MTYYHPKAKKSRSYVKTNGLKITHKGLPSSLVILILTFLVLGILAGGFAVKALTKNDCFVINAVNEPIDLEIGGEGNPDTYTETGAKCVFFGKDLSDTVNIEYFYREDMSHNVAPVTSVDPSVPGYYYAVYTSSHFKYKNVKLVRTITVIQEEE